jgi:hypothetical protein
VDSGAKAFQGNITFTHAGVSTGVTVLALGAGLILTGPAALIVAGGAILYNAQEDNIWRGYDKENAKNYVEEDE